MDQKQLTIVIKVGTSSLIRLEQQVFNIGGVATLCEVVKSLKDKGHKVIIVSSGAVGVGCQRLGLRERPTEISKRQALAAAGQIHLMKYYDDFFSAIGITCAQVMLTLDNLASNNQFHNTCRTFQELFAYGIVPVVNENDTVAVEQLHFGDNDTLSAKVATAVEADWLFLLTDVDALYDKNPTNDPTARPIHVVHDIAQLQVSTDTRGTAWGTGGMSTKLTAARIATSAGCNTVISLASQPYNIERILNGEQLGTVFHHHPKALKKHKRFLLMMPPKGKIVVDDGAVRAVRQKAKSLFSAGITNVLGDFNAQEAVEVCDKAGTIIAIGLANYTSSEVLKVKGQKSESFLQILGYLGAEEVIHRANISMVSIRNPGESAEATPPPYAVLSDAKPEDAPHTATRARQIPAQRSSHPNLSSTAGPTSHASDEQRMSRGEDASKFRNDQPSSAEGHLQSSEQLIPVINSAPAISKPADRPPQSPQAEDRGIQYEPSSSTQQGVAELATVSNETATLRNGSIRERDDSPGAARVSDPELRPDTSAGDRANDLVLSPRSDSATSLARLNDETAVPHSGEAQSRGRSHEPVETSTSENPQISGRDQQPDRPNPLPSPASGFYRYRSLSPHGRGDGDSSQAQPQSSPLQGTVPALKIPEPVAKAHGLDSETKDSDGIEKTGILSPQQASTAMSSFQGPIRGATEEEIALRRALVAAAKSGKSIEEVLSPRSAEALSPNTSPSVPLSPSVSPPQRIGSGEMQQTQGNNPARSSNTVSQAVHIAVPTPHNVRSSRATPVQSERNRPGYARTPSEPPSRQSSGMLAGTSPSDRPENFRPMSTHVGIPAPRVSGKSFLTPPIRQQDFNRRNQGRRSSGDGTPPSRQSSASLSRQASANSQITSPRASGPLPQSATFNTFNPNPRGTPAAPQRGTVPPQRGAADTQRPGADPQRPIGASHTAPAPQRSSGASQTQTPQQIHNPRPAIKRVSSLDNKSNSDTRSNGVGSHSALPTLREEPAKGNNDGNVDDRLAILRSRDEVSRADSLGQQQKRVSFHEDTWMKDLKEAIDIEIGAEGKSEANTKAQGQAEDITEEGWLPI